MLKSNAKSNVDSSLLFAKFVFYKVSTTSNCNVPSILIYLGDLKHILYFYIGENSLKKEVIVAHTSIIYCLFFTTNNYSPLRKPVRLSGPYIREIHFGVVCYLFSNENTKKSIVSYRDSPYFNLGSFISKTPHAQWMFLVHYRKENRVIMF